jgi:citrate synthase
MEYRPGLEDIPAAETAISYLDLEREEIVIRGYDLIELARKRTYTDVVGLLLYGKLPDEEGRKALEAELLKVEVPEAVYTLLRALPLSAHPMDRLRTAVSALGAFEPDLEDPSPEAAQRRGLRAIARSAAVVANLERVALGEAPKPLQGDTFPEAFLWAVRGQKPLPEEVRAFDQSLIAYSEHELPNSTFAARVIASTLSDLYAALTGAVASLKGPLHGGANEAVIHLMLEAKTPEGLEALMREKLARKERIMGFGHRVYMRRMDPRAALMKETLKALAQSRPEAALWLEMGERGEQVMQECKGLYPNLDYYAALVYYVLGLPIPLYTPIFFAARTVGLVAHVNEQLAHNRLFRPRVIYAGQRGLTL